MSHPMLTIMYRDRRYTGVGGYLNSHARTDKTDVALMEAAGLLNLDYADLFLWVNSRCARHFMDQEPTMVSEFVADLQRTLPSLREEEGRE